jgi:hypothetical protein
MLDKIAEYDNSAAIALRSTLEASSDSLRDNPETLAGMVHTVLGYESSETEAWCSPPPEHRSDTPHPVVLTRSRHPAAAAIRAYEALHNETTNMVGVGNDFRNRDCRDNQDDNRHHYS